jgi:type 1 glutamine amidotransferase
MARPLLANLVTGSPARNHDFDFARRKLLDALYDAGDIRTDVFNNYDSCAAIDSGDLLVNYTSQVHVSDEACAALRNLSRARRALVGDPREQFRARQPASARILGSRFIAHPPYMRYRVEVTAPEDPLLDGIDAAFEVDDELYVVEQADDIQVLLHTRWGGEAMRRTFDEAFRPLMYRRQVGDGGVLYLALGHCNRPFDKPRPDSPDRPDLRGPWGLPVYQTLIRRGVEWAAARRPL